MPLINVSKLNFAYNTEPVVSDASVIVEGGTIVSLLGPSGCGKSTLLRLIAGLETPISGQIEIKTTTAESNKPTPPLQTTPLRLLFQDYDAYPWLTTLENVRFGSGSKPFPTEGFAMEILQRVGLKDNTSSYPAELSGGMKKRLALARCLIRKPPLLLLDEPFASLDIEAKCAMYDLVQKLWTEHQSTVVMVTHDLHEAILLSDRILISSPKPLRIIEDVQIPFGRPRDESIVDTNDYREIRRRITKALLFVFDEQKNQ